MDIDCIFNIIIYVDYSTTISILQTCKFFKNEEEKKYYF
jgi:hypothetical protein